MRFVLGLLDAVFNIYYLILLARVVFSWLPNPPAGKFAEIVYNLTEPLLGAVRKVIPPTSMGIDFSPLVGMVLLWVFQSVLVNLLSTLAWGL